MVLNRLIFLRSNADASFFSFPLWVALKSLHGINMNVPLLFTILDEMEKSYS